MMVCRLSHKNSFKAFFAQSTDFIFFRIFTQTRTRWHKQGINSLIAKELRACTCLSNTYTTRTRVVHVSFICHVRVQPTRTRSYITD